MRGGTPAVPEGAFHAWPHVTRDDQAAVADAVARATPWRWPFETVRDLEQMDLSTLATQAADPPATRRGPEPSGGGGRSPTSDMTVVT